MTEMKKAKKKDDKQKIDPYKGNKSKYMGTIINEARLILFTQSRYRQYKKVVSLFYLRIVMQKSQINTSEPNLAMFSF